MNSRIKKFFSNQIVIVLGHILAWVFVLFLPIVMPLRKPPPMINRPPMPQPENMPLIEQFFWMHLVSNMPLVGFFYLNYYVLIPKILYRRTTSWYILSLIGCGIIFYYYNYITRQMLLGEQFNFSPFFGLFPILFILALSLALRVTTDRLREERERKEQETEGLKSELAFLRSQVSPHFLFNMMNNVVALSRIKPQLVEPTLIQLSHLMRYMLYESDENKVSLEKEMEYLENYIALQKMRFSKNVDIQFHKNNLENTEGVAIEPMLLIPFVENAFKHGVVLITEPFIKINVMLVDKILIFNVINKYSSEVNEEKDAASGIGLRNVMRRLELLYAENHTLNINQEEDIFEVHLTIHLKTD